MKEFDSVVNSMTFPSLEKIRIRKAQKQVDNTYVILLLLSISSCSLLMSSTQEPVE